MSSKDDIPTRVDNLEMKLAGAKIEIDELREIFTASMHELASSNKDLADGYKELSANMKLLGEKIGDALKGFQTAVPP